MSIQIGNSQINLPTQRGLFYGGAWHEATGGAVQEFYSPADGTALGVISWAQAEDVDKAVAAVKRGFHFAQDGGACPQAQN